MSLRKVCLSPLIAALLILAPSSRAQFTFTGSDETVVTGNPVSVSITVDNFVNGTSAQFSLGWNPALLQYSSAAANPSFPASFFPFGTSSVGSGQLGFGWAGNQDETVANGTTMFTVTFNAIGAGGTSPQIGFGSSPTPIEITANGGTDVTGSTIFNAGTVTINAVPEPAQVALVTSLSLLGLAALIRHRRSRFPRPANPCSAIPVSRRFFDRINTINRIRSPKSCESC